MKLLMCLGVALFLNCAKFEQGTSRIKSSTFGLNRVITLYAGNGTIIQQWEGHYKVNIEGGSARFMDKGKAVYISGTYTVIEK